MKIHGARSALASMLCLCAANVAALEMRLGEDVAAKLTGTVTFGTGIRTEEPAPENFGRSEPLSRLACEQGEYLVTDLRFRRRLGMCGTSHLNGSLEISCREFANSTGTLLESIGSWIPPPALPSASHR